MQMLLTTFYNDRTNAELRPLTTMHWNPFVFSYTRIIARTYAIFKRKHIMLELNSIQTFHVIRRIITRNGASTDKQTDKPNA